MEYELHATENEIRNGSGGGRRAVPPQGVPKNGAGPAVFPAGGQENGLAGAGPVDQTVHRTGESARSGGL